MEKFLLILMLVSFCLFMVPTVMAFFNWIRNKELESSYTLKRTRVILTILAFIFFITFLAASCMVINPDVNHQTESSITIIPISNIYTSNIDTDNKSHYYVSKESEDEIRELIVSRISVGESNYVLSRKLKNGTVINELVLKDKNAIKKLPKL